MRKFQIIIAVAVLVLGAAGSSARVARKATSPSAGDARATVKVTSFQFTPKLLTVALGTTVEWVNEGGRHSVVADDGSFKSEVLKQGDKFEHKFDKAGTFAYHCEFHGDKGGKDMAGKIIVKGK